GAGRAQGRRHVDHVGRWPLSARAVQPMRRAILVALSVAGCGGGAEKGSAPPPPPIAARPPAAAAPAGSPGSPVAAMQPGVEQSKDALLQEVRKRQLTNEDFKESPTNRDPFRSFLTTFATQVINVKP